MISPAPRHPLPEQNLFNTAIRLLFSKRFVRQNERRFSKAYSFLPVSGVSRPVFIIGCGRSGKSTLAGLLSIDQRIIYLNEPRHLWFSVFPESDIWTSRACMRHGKLALDENDFDSLKAKRLSRLFRLQAIKNKGSIIVEELAINNFRLNLIKKIFPDARFIHIYRNGLEVAELIEKTAKKGGWFGAGSYKWKKLVEYAKRDESTSQLPALCSTFKEIGLLEWRLSTESVVSFFLRTPDAPFLEINSSRIIEQPAGVLSEVLSFLDMESDTVTSARGNGLNRAASADWRDVSEKEALLGGDLLPLSMETQDNLTQHYRERNSRLSESL